VTKFRELVEEFRTVFAGRSNLADSIIPPAIFVIVNAVLGFEAATWGSLGVALAWGASGQSSLPSWSPVSLAEPRDISSPVSSREA